MVQVSTKQRGNMRILLIEDDPVQAEFLLGKIQENFANRQVHTIRTESELRLNIQSVVKLAPSIAIVDLMLRWTDPAPNLPPRPDEVIKGGSERAGIRCAQVLRSHLPSIPIILYTALDVGSESMEKLKAEMDDLGVVYMEKTADFTALFNSIKRASSSGASVARTTSRN